MKKHLDLRGLSCPEPVLRTKKIIDDPTVSSVEALVDSEVNVQNLERLARSQNLFVKKEALGDHFRISIDRQKDTSDKGHEQQAASSAVYTYGGASGAGSGGSSGGTGSAYDSGPGADSGTNHHPALSVGAGLTQTTVTRGGGTVVFITKDTFGHGADSEKDHSFSRNLLDVFLQTIKQSGLKPSTLLLANSGVKLIDPDASTYKVLSELKEAGTTVLACGLCLDYYGLKEKIAIEQVTNMFAICEYLFAADQVLSP